VKIRLIRVIRVLLKGAAEFFSFRFSFFIFHFVFHFSFFISFFILIFDF